MTPSTRAVGKRAIFFECLLAFPCHLKEIFGVVIVNIPAAGRRIYQAVEAADGRPKMPEFIIDYGKPIMHVGKVATECKLDLDHQSLLSVRGCPIDFPSACFQLSRSVGFDRRRRGSLCQQTHVIGFESYRQPFEHLIHPLLKRTSVSFGVEDIVVQYEYSMLRLTRRLPESFKGGRGSCAPPSFQGLPTGKTRGVGAPVNVAVSSGCGPQDSLWRKSVSLSATLRR